MRRGILFWYLRNLVIAVMALIAGCAAPGSVDQGIQPVADTSGGESGARNRARIHAELAAGYFELGNLGVALEEVNIAQRSDPGYAAGYGIAGLVYAALKDDQRAEENFRHGLSLSPADPDINNNFGLFLCQRKRESEGIRHLLAAVRNPLYQNPERSYVNAGFCARNQGDVNAAQEFFQRAITVRPNQPQALYQLADLAFARNDFAMTQGYLRRLSQAGPATAEILWLALRVERRLGNRLAEESYAQQLRKNFPESRETAALQAGRFE